MLNEKLSYPIGKFNPPITYTKAQITSWIDEIAAFPGRLKQSIIGITEEQLDVPYRLEGWTLRQVIHHIADSHANILIRFKLALTEENPVIKPYNESEWALLPDYLLPVESALKMIEGIHFRWSAILQSLSDEQWERKFYHPEQKISTTLKKAAGLYAWHGNHHLAHITNAIASF